MTVCIAAACRNGLEPNIVVCTDGKISGPLGSQEFWLKDRLLPGNWRCLTAGEDYEISSLLPLFKARFLMPDLIGDANETNVKPAVEEVFKQRKRQKDDQFTASKWGMSFEEFRKARSHFPEDVYHRNIQQIEQSSVVAECLVVGFLGDGLTHIVHAHGSHGIVIKDDWAAAGSGADLAQTVLLHREQYSSNLLEETLYNVYEAKRYAERNPTVGKEVTLLSVLAPGKLPQALSESGIEYMASKFKRFGPQPVDVSDINLDQKHFFKLNT